MSDFDLPHSRVRWLVASRLAAVVLPLFLAIGTSTLAHVIGEDKPNYDPSARPPDVRMWAPNMLPSTAAAFGILSQVPLSVTPELMARTIRLAQAPRMSPEADRMARIFRPFAPGVAVRADERFLFVESDSIPNHRMMVGITAWQQQVPIPQPYFGDNAWQIPLHPVPSDTPLYAREHFFRGAIALAANGVPIFNPIKNDGVTDTFLAGELDEFGGHAGRGDDYHYHISPLHLQEQIGAGLPVAYALDGYAIFGMSEPDGRPVGELDSFNGHATDAFGYHYHSTVEYPYLNGGFHGHVVEIDGQVDPQPRTRGVRPATRPLRGAAIIGFTSPVDNYYSLVYTLADETRHVNYMISDTEISYWFIDGQGNIEHEIYSRTEPRTTFGGNPTRYEQQGGMGTNLGMGGGMGAMGGGGMAGGGGD